MNVISKRISAAMRHLSEKDYENALIQITIAIDATAKKKWPEKGVGTRIRNFIKEYESFIYKMASSGHIILISGRILIQGRELSTIIYDLVRCALQHGDELGDRVIILGNANTIGVKDGKIIINVGHIYGLLLSVILDPTNILEHCDSNPFLQEGDTRILVNEIWGNMNKFRELSSVRI